MSHAHVCDNCKKVAPIGAAIGWWLLAAIELEALTMGQKPEYHFCSRKCTHTYLSTDGNEALEHVQLKVTT